MHGFLPIYATVQHKIDGTVEFDYYEKVHSVDKKGRQTYNNFSGKAIVPSEIVGKGGDAIREYIHEHVTKDIRKQKADHKRNLADYRTSINIPLSVKFDKEILLEGRVVWSDEKDSYVVRLESPTQAEQEWNYGESFGGAMAGLRKFDGTKLTSDGKADAERILTWLYRVSVSPHKPKTEHLTF